MKLKRIDVLFTVGRNGNGTIYHRKTPTEISNLVKQYERKGWEVSLVCADSGNWVWYEIN